MAMTAPPIERAGLWTAEKLLALPDDDLLHEIIAGELIEMPPPSAKHGKYAMRLGGRMDAHASEHRLGTVFAAETGFILSRDPDTVLAPDIAFVRADRLPPEDEWEGYLALAPDLVVEVISPSDTASRVLSKVLMYLDAGTQLVITLDPDRKAVVVYGPDRVGRILTVADTLDGGDVLPGFRLSLADLFA